MVVGVTCQDIHVYQMSMWRMMLELMVEVMTLPKESWVEIRGGRDRGRGFR